MTRLGRLLTALALLFALVAAPGQRALASQEPAVKRFQVEQVPRIWAHGAVLLDWQTGELLWEQAGHRRLHPASTTKVLTALIAIEQLDLEAKVKVSRRAAHTIGSSMYLKEGEVHSVYDLLHGLLLRSGNDAAVALAETVSGSVESFATLMNRRGRELGAKDSNWVNPHGLTHEQHFSTAYDLAVVTRAALQNPLFAQIVATPAKELTYEAMERQVLLYNTNRLLHSLPGADGVKTGTTGAAGPCLIASATREEQKLIAVVLNASNRWGESAKLLEWGFRNFRIARVGRAGEVIRQVPVRDGKKTHLPVALKDDLAVLLPRAGTDVPALNLDLQRVTAPVAKGTVLGHAELLQPDGRRHRVEVVAAESMEEANWLDHLRRGLLNLLDTLDHLGVTLL